MPATPTTKELIEPLSDSTAATTAAPTKNRKLISWVEEMHELWGLRADEVEGHSLFDLDIGLPVAALRPAIDACLAGEAQEPRVELDAVNRRGAPIRCAATCRPLYKGEDVTGVVVMVQRIDADDRGPGVRRYPRRAMPDNPAR